MSPFQSFVVILYMAMLRNYFKARAGMYPPRTGSILIRKRHAEKNRKARFSVRPPHTGRTFLQHLLLFSIFAGITLPLSAQDVPYTVWFEHVNAEVGLSTNITYALFEDSRGYLWVGTEEGLNRYDGYGVRTYTSTQLNHPRSLNADFIRAITETPDGSLWIGTDGGGLSRFNPQTETFVHYLHHAEDATSLGSNQIFSLLVSRDGTLWVGTGGGLDRYDAETDSFSHFYIRGQSEFAGRAMVIHEAPDGMLWLGTGNLGLGRLDPSTGTITAYCHSEENANSLLDDRVGGLADGPNGTLWIGTWGGLNHFDPATERFTPYTHRDGDATSLSANDIRAVVSEPDGTLWIGTWGGGLNHFDPATGRFKRYQYEEGNPNSLSANDVWAVHTGQDGTLWVGTVSGGVNRLVREIKPFTHYRHRLEDGSSLSYMPVRAIQETQDGSIWVGTFGGLFRLMDKRAGTFESFQHREGDPTSLVDDFIGDLYETRDSTLWVGTIRTGESNWFNPDTKTFVKTDLPQAYRLLETQDGMFWTMGEGILNRIDPETGAVTTFSHRADDPTSLGDPNLNVLYESRDGTLWIGTNNGLDRFDETTETFIHYQSDGLDNGTLSDEEASSIYQSQDGTIWIGTSYGLNRMVIHEDVNTSSRYDSVSFISYDPETTNFEGSWIKGILEDDRGMFWLSLLNGKLARFNPETEHFRHFGPNEGIQMGGFYEATTRSRDGTMYFGGQGGVIAFDPAQIEHMNTVPRLYLTYLWLFNQVVRPGPNGVLQAPLSETKSVRFQHNENDISIGFVGIDLTNTEDIRYNYRLLPYDQDWRGVTEQRQATYTSLPPGRYRFEVKAANSDGIWSEVPVILGVVIQPPWWKTWWAYLLYSIPLFGLGLSIIWVAHRRAVRQERERSHQALEAAYCELEQAHTHLKATQAQLVQAEKMASLGELTAGIAHEIKNPLNFINNFSEVNEELAQELREAYEADPDIKLADLLDLVTDLEQNAAIINQHGKRADGIVSAMMQHASGGTGKRESTDVNALLEEYVNLAYHGKRAQIEGFNCEIQRAYDEAIGNVEMIPQNIGRVFLNLLSNAFDAVHEKARSVDGDYEPTVRVQTQRTNADGTSVEAIAIRIQDNGPGIPQHFREKIFEPFFTTKPTGSGTGLGLSLSYDIITKGHGGTLEVESTEGDGATFIITLPA